MLNEQLEQLVKERTAALTTEIAERQKMEEKLRLAAAEWRTAFDSISDWVSVHDKDFKIVRVNRALADFLKMKPQEIIGRPCHELLHGDNEANRFCAHQEALRTRKPARKEFFNPHLGIYMEVLCSPVFDDKGEVAFTVHVARDITEQKRMQEQLMITDRLATIGQLASGIAHELNNPLTSIIGFSDMLLQRELPQDIKDDLKIINDQAQRTAKVVRGILLFARRQHEEKQLVDINESIQRMLDLRAYEHKVGNIMVDARFASNLPQITANAFQIQQIFVNIIINAEYFMTEAHGRGTLTITTEPAGGFVRASFADDGPGISQENLDRLFTPFFTTKEAGKGTGLGLSICHGIATEHGGKICAQSELGKGATFIVELPIPQRG